jgi:hypothetical protein
VSDAVLNLTPEQKQAIVTPAMTIIEQARKFVVKTDTDYTEELKSIKSAQKVLATRKATLTDPVNATLRAIRALFQGPEAALEEAERTYKRSMISYQGQKEAERREAQRKLDEAAEKERQRKEREAAKLRSEAEAAAAAGKAERAAVLEQRADVAQETAASVVAPTVQAEPPRTAGIATREVWSAVVVDFKALVGAVAAGTVPLLALEPSSKFLNQQAKACKRELNYPGVSAVVEKSIAAGSR